MKVQIDSYEIDSESVGFCVREGRQMDEALLQKFELVNPGHWICSEDRTWAGDTQHVLLLVQGQFDTAVVAYSMVEVPTRDNIFRQSEYQRRLNGIH